MSERKFAIRIDGEVVLSVDEIWPDGDAPADPQPRDVEKVLLNAGRLTSVLVDWNMGDDFDWSVSRLYEGGGNG